MGSTLANRALTTPDDLDVIGRPKMATATLADNVSVDALSSVVMDTLKTVYGKQGAAAAQLGKDKGNFSRDVKAGRFTLQQQAALGRQFLAELGEALVEEFSPVNSPQALAKRRLEDAIEAIQDARHHLERVE
jgi:hypothetical protein